MVLTSIIRFIANSVFDTKQPKNKKHVRVYSEKTAAKTNGTDSTDTPPVPKKPIDPNQMGSNVHNPIPRVIKLSAEDEEEVSPGQMTVNMCTWLFNVYTAAFWFWIPAFFGDFEAYFFYIRE